MAVQDVTLNPRIIQAAIKVFLQKGFSEASLSEICKCARVTTGAIYNRYDGKEALFSSLVEPTIDSLNEYIKNHVNEHSERIEAKGMNFEWARMEEEYLIFLDFLYDNYQGFKLLLCKADGSQYSNFLNDILDDFSNQSYQFFQIMYEKGEISHLIDENEYHLIYTAAYAAMFEVIFHDFKKEDAIKYFKTLNKFFNWERIFQK